MDTHTPYGLINLFARVTSHDKHYPYLIPSLPAGVHTIRYYTKLYRKGSWQKLLDFSPREFLIYSAFKEIELWVQSFA